MAPADDLLPAGPVLLDGAMASELEKRGVDVSTPLWSALALRTDPDEITAVHARYFAAGARIATTDSYQATVPGFEAAGVPQAEASSLIARSATLARRAARAWQAAHPGAGPWVAGSVGPYGAFLADGSEYRGDYALGTAKYERFHRPRLEALAHGGVDLFAVETQPKLDEAQAVIALIAREFPDIPAWVSFQLRDAHTLADGTPLEDAARWAEEQPSLAAVGINCVPPQIVAPALELLSSRTRHRLLCYPNSGEHFDPATSSWRPPAAPTPLAAFVPQWLDAGAQIIGGCCRSTPDDITSIARALDREG